MTDRLSPEQRHLCMSHIRSKDTKPELKVRRWLWQHGYRYRLNVKSVPGKADIVMRKYRTAIFVNGCFWHGHHVQCTMYNVQCTMGEKESDLEERLGSKVKVQGSKFKVQSSKFKGQGSMGGEESALEEEQGSKFKVQSSKFKGQGSKSGEEWMVEDSACCKIPKTNREFWVNKIRRNQERDQQNYATLRDNGWQVIVVWECQLKPKYLEQTMLRVEQLLLDYYIATLKPKRPRYAAPPEKELPVAAEDPAPYD